MHWWILSIFGNEFILFDITQDNLVIALTNLNTVKKYTNYILPFYLLPLPCILEDLSSYIVLHAISQYS
jgi:hypothetical protein